MSNRAQAAVTLTDIHTESQRVQAQMLRALENYEQQASHSRHAYTRQDWLAEANLYAVVMTALKRR